MPKVGTERLFHKGSGKCLFVTINLVAKTKRFQVMDMPEDIVKWNASRLQAANPEAQGMFSGEVIADTYDGLVEKAKEVYNSYYSQQISEKRVILYKISGGKHKDSKGASIGIEYRLMWRISVGEQDFYSTANYERTKQPEDGFSAGGPRFQNPTDYEFKPYTEVDYTEELEAFFKNTIASLEAMIDNVKDFFGDTSQKFLESLKTRPNLLGDGNKS